MSDTLDLSQNEFENYLALALQGHGLPQGMCKMAARVGLLMALDHRDPTDQALSWTAKDMAMLAGLVNAPLPPRQRVTSVSSKSWKKIKNLAVKTYVAESESSKLLGAGENSQR